MQDLASPSHLLDVLRQHRRSAVLLAALLYAAVFGLRLLHPNPADAIGVLYILPVAVVAGALGFRAGLAAALAAFGLLALGSELLHPKIGISGYLTRAAAYCLTGALTGLCSERLRQAYEGEVGRLSSIVASSGHAVVTTTTDGVIESWNPAAQSVYGYSQGEALGRRLDFILPAAVGNGQGVVGRAVAGESVDLETEAARKDGGVVDVAITASPIKDSAERVIAVSTITRDVSERKRRKAEARSDAEVQAWVRRIGEALEEDRFVLYSQPILELRSGELTREELLLRMLDEEGKVVPPGEFLPAAERVGLISDVDRWVVEHAVPLAVNGRVLGINLSGTSIGDPAITHLIERCVERHRIDPGCLTFEVTETAAVRDLELARVFADRLQRMGVDLALDDFGTGYGSFTYLKHLPAQFIKIDMDFIRGLDNDFANQQVVRAIIGVARDFGVKTVAEGVEDGATLELLKHYSVDFAQGYHVGRPQPVAERTNQAVRS